MISRRLKMAYYAILRLPMKINGVLYKKFRSPASNNSNKILVHLGPSQKNYLTGWLNLDANFISSTPDIWANLEDTLPFREDSVDLFYSHHVVEHLQDRFLLDHFKQMHHALKPGGAIRIAGPNADMAIQKFLEKDEKWFIDFPDAHDSIVGKLVNFILCRNEHFYILTKSYLEDIASKSGFVDISFELAGKTTTIGPDIDSRILSQESWSSPTHPHTILLEARKPV